MMAMDVIEDNCCHARVIPDNYIASNRESASKLKVNLCIDAPGDRAAWRARSLGGPPGRNAASLGLEDRQAPRLHLLTAHAALPARSDGRVAAFLCDALSVVGTSEQGT